MTHDVIQDELRNLGSLAGALVEIDITSLDAAGEETSFEPTEGHVGDVFGISFLAQENPDYVFRYEPADGHLHVTDVGTASDTQAGTDVGTVRMLIVGRN